jgi:hydroxymethylpyrimidine/phosphomethylpyrimidine kinase
VTIPRILVIAGSDSGGGAGIQADIKTITMLGGHAMTAITAITAQNTLGVMDVMAVPAAMVLAQIDAVADDIGIDAVKIGMIGSAETIDAVAERLMRLGSVPIIFDPVMVASSGAALADPATVAAFGRLMEIATIITPNIPELAALTGREVPDEAGMETAARELASRFGCAVVAKGGHLPGDDLVDLLVEPDGVSGRWTDVRIDTRHNHGTGCTLASAIATGVASGLTLSDAIARGREYVRAALAQAPGFGSGHGPMGHGIHDISLFSSGLARNEPIP